MHKSKKNSNKWEQNVDMKTKTSWDTKNGDEVFIVASNLNYPEGKWEFYKITQDANPPYLDRLKVQEFESKTKALKFAKEYMRSH